LREDEDIEAMRQALADGTIDCIATDHAPHSSVEKDCELNAASPGMIGLETTIPLLLGLVRDGVLTATRFVEAMSTSAARVGRLAGGSLRVGEVADITMLDPELRWTVARDTIRSKQLNSPWLGKEMRGACTRTIVRGEVVFER
jgi:dihydroorotase